MGFAGRLRLLFAKLLFWIDLSYFDGTIVFLVVLNLAFIFLSFFQFNSLIKEIGKESEKNNVMDIVLKCVALSLLFSWIQNENIYWGFQSQFYLAQLVPLSAFILLHRAHGDLEHKQHYFFFSCIFGLAAIGTMANGVLTLPLLCTMAIVLRMSRTQILTLLTLSIASLFAYFYDYHTVTHHGSLREAITNHPIQFVHYVSLYLGGPIYYFSNSCWYECFVLICGVLEFYVDSWALVDF